MIRKNFLSASLGAIAKEAGVSRMTASNVLRNCGRVGEKTRTRILKVARKLGYSPDPRTAIRMEIIRATKSKELEPIAWLNTNIDEDAWSKWKYLSPYLEGAKERALELGYRIDEIWAGDPKTSMRRISKILYNRGVEACIITHPARHFQLEWKHFAAVAIGGALLAPRLNRVIDDFHFNLTLTLKILKRYGYKRIGICFSEYVDRYTSRLYHLIAFHYIHSMPAVYRVPALVYVKDEQVGEWILKHRPEVIVCADHSMTRWVEAVGLRVPEDIGIVHLAVDDDVLDWAGIHSNKKEMGATAAENVISLLRNRRFGLPSVPSTILIRGKWQAGKTLLLPRVVPGNSTEPIAKKGRRVAG